MRTGNIIITRNPHITAYEIAVDNGFVGTEVEWLASLGNDGVVSDTYANWNTKRLAGTLPVGALIKTTDSDEADLGVIVRVTSGSTVDPNGIAGFLNADHGPNGAYADVEGFVAQEGVWGPNQIGNYEEGDVVIYNNQHYLVGAGVLDDEQPDSSVNYTLLTRADQLDGQELGYIEEWDQVVYDFLNDEIMWRMDILGNKINRASIPFFQWGDFDTGPIVQHNVFNEINTLNNGGIISGVDNGIGTSMDLSFNNGQIYFTINGIEQSIFLVDNSGQIELNLNGFMNGVFGPGNSGFVRSYLYNNSFVAFIENTSEIVSRHYDSSYADFNGNEGSIYHAEVAKGCDLQLSLQSGYTHENCKYAAPGTYSFPSDISYSNKELSNTGSTFDADVLITVNDATITPPNYAGVIKLDTNLGATARITDIDSIQPYITFKKDSIQNFEFVSGPTTIFNSGGDKTLYVNEIDTITYKKNAPLDVWAEQHYVTFD